MQLHSLDSFLNFWAKIRHRTTRVIHRIPPGKIEWTFRQSKYNLGDLVTHLALPEVPTPPLSGLTSEEVLERSEDGESSAP